MKKLIYIILFSISILTFAQKPPNRFEAEEIATALPKEKVIESPIAKNPGDPGDPMPIDDYIPLLVITAIGLIIFNQKRFRQSS